MSVEIYDFEGNPRDEQWLAQTWGVTISKPPGLAEGEKHFALKAVTFGEGPCVVMNSVFDEDPGPMDGIMIALYWPGSSCPSPPESGEPPHTTEVYPHDWNDHFVFGFTKDGGVWGAAMGPDAMVNEGNSGPHCIWIHHPVYRSDLVSGLGWRTGTNHRAPRLTWGLTAGEPAQPPPEEPPPTTPPEAGEALILIQEIQLRLARLQEILEEFDIKAEELAGLL